MSTRLEDRASTLATFGATAAVAHEVLVYNGDGLGPGPAWQDIGFPLDDELFVEPWREYSRDAAASGVRALADRLVQLHFPIRDGISLNEEYRDVTRRGASPEGMASATGLVLVRPAQCTVAIHATWAGAIPLIETGCREDFVSLLRAFTARNEPVPVPESQGACIVAGYNNWDRVRRLRASWTAEHPTASFSLGQIAHLKEQYQDRFILLSDGWYSGVAPESVGLPQDEWRRLSKIIRREHECAHYWTRRVFGSMNNRVFDELIADYCGILAACGRLRADWLLAFLGIDGSGRCRESGRLRNYRGDPPLSDDAFGVLVRMVAAVVENLAIFDRRHADDLSGPRGALLILLTLSRMSLEELASSQAQELLADELHQSRTLASSVMKG